MAQIETYGLVRDKNLSDVPNPQTALTHLLTQLVGSQYTSDDLNFLENLSLHPELKERLPKIVDIVINKPGISIPARPLVTFKNRVDKYKQLTGDLNFFGGQGLVARYYNWNSTYPGVTSLVTPFDSSILDDKFPVETEVGWERGNINYDIGISRGINNDIGIVVYSGLFKSRVTGEHIFRVNLRTTGSMIIELTNMAGDNYIVGDNRYEPSSQAAKYITTRVLEKFTFYKIKIFWLKSPELAARNKENILDIRFKLPGSTFFRGLHHLFLYPEGHDQRSIGALGDFYINKLPVGGTNFFDIQNDNTENYSIGGSLSSSYKSLVTRGRVNINYTPPKKYGDVVITRNNVNLSSSSIIISLSNTAGITSGNLILSKSKTISAFTYVTEVIDNSTVSINKELSQSVSNDTLYFIDQKGLKGYILEHTPNVALSTFGGLGQFYGDKRNIAAGDVVISDNIITDYTRISSVQPSSISLNRTIADTGHTDFILFYYKNGLQNLSLDGFCTGTGSLPVLNGISKSDAVSNTINITIDSLVDYEGKKVNLNSLLTTNTAISAYRVDYGGGISNGTYVTAVDSNTGNVTISQPTIGVIKSGSSILFSLSTPSNPATNDPKFSCFAPGDTSAPFFASLNGIETPLLSSIDIGFKSLEFKTLNLLDPTDSAVNSINHSTATFNNKLRVTDSTGRVLDLLLKSS
jgi:hypothetical protein